jgi:cytosine/creatinine deaminase
METTIRDVRPWGRARSDVYLDDDRIATVQPHDPTTAPARDVIEGRGRLLIPSFADAHVHLDSTRLGLPFRPHTGAPGILDMVMNDRRHWRAAEWPIAKRATHALELMVARGATRVRSYAQIDSDCRLERFEGVVAAREALAGCCDVDIVAFPQAGLVRDDAAAPLIEEALRSGAGAVGGIDPCELDRDPVRHLDLVFGLAEKYQVPVDIHLHEPGDLAVWTTDLICERTRACGMQGNVSIAHGYALGGVSEATTARLIAELAELDISMTTVAPSINTALPLERLTAAGIRVGLGQDGQRDYWSPYGNADMLDRSWQLAFINEFCADDLVEHCVAIATIGGRSVMSPTEPRLMSIKDRPGIAPGDAADLVIVAGETVTSAVMDRPDDRTVIHRGRVVADQLALVDDRALEERAVPL